MSNIQNYGIKLCILWLLEAGQTAGKAGPLRLKDMCCSEEQRKVGCVVVLPVDDIVECEETSSSRRDRIESVWVQITLKKDSCSAAAVVQGCIRLLTKVSNVFRKICSSRVYHYYRFYLLKWRKISISVGWAQVFLVALADVFFH